MMGSHAAIAGRAERIYIDVGTNVISYYSAGQSLPSFLFAFVFSLSLSLPLFAGGPTDRVPGNSW